jgi:integral membrane sensor domain MASE1
MVLDVEKALWCWDGGVKVIVIGEIVLNGPWVAKAWDLAMRECVSVAS